MSATKKKGSVDKAMNRPMPSNEDSTAAMLSKKGKGTVLASNSAKVSPDKVTKSEEPFRFRWQKLGQFDYQKSLIKAHEANSPQEKKGTARVKKSESDTEDDFSNDDDSVKPPTAPDADESDVDGQGERRSDGDYEEAAPATPAPGRTNQKYKMKKGLKPNPNGRVVGRKLVMWHRPRMVEKLMLHLQYECHRNGIRLPWDKAVERLSSGSSGSSAQQHLNKLRDVLITEGHLVPPLLGKASVAQDESIRGFIRDESSQKPTDTRIVKWGELVVDRKENLEIDGVIRGSGNYRRGLNKQLEKAQKASGERRNRLPVELRVESSPVAVSNPRVDPSPLSKKPMKRSSSDVSSSVGSVDVAQMAPDEEYDPTNSAKKGKYGLRKRNRTKFKVEDSDDELTENSGSESLRKAINTALTPPQGYRMSPEDGHGLPTPPASKLVALQVPLDFLKDLEAGSSLKTELSSEEDGPIYRNSEVDSDNAGDNDYDQASDGCNSEIEQQIAPAYPQTPLARTVAMSHGYRGVELHGTKGQYDRAILDDTDPLANGFGVQQTPQFTPYQSAYGPVGSGYGYSSPAPYGSRDGRHDYSNFASPSPYGDRPATLPRTSHSNFSAGSPSGYANYGGNTDGRLGRNGFEDFTSRGIYDDDHVPTHGTRYDISPTHGYGGRSSNFQTQVPPQSQQMRNYDGSNDHQSIYGLDLFGNRNMSRSGAPPSAAASGFHVATDNAADLNEIQIDGVSEAPSSPAPYLRYMTGGEDDKENREQYALGEFEPY